MTSDITTIKDGPKDGRKVFRKLGTCSRTFFHILNREFGNPRELEERASDVLAGGIMQKGYQCGMLWGASLAIGAEAYRSCGDRNQAINVAVKATQQVLASFLKREHTTSCREITRCNFSSKWSFAKYMISGRFLHCFNLAQNWAPEAVKSASYGLSNQNSVSQKECLSCATEVAKKMGASEEEMVMVAGFAGGLGLSGDACGALSAAIWMKSLDWCREELKKSAIKNTNSKRVLDIFYKTTNSKIVCSEITGLQFKSMNDHTNYIKKGGCANLINKLSEV